MGTAGPTPGEGAQGRQLLLRDGFLLYASYLLKYIFPFLVVPFLARRLGPERYGEVLAALSLASIVALIVDYGLSMSGTRDIASENRSDLGWLMSSILTAKLYVAVPAITIGLAAGALSPVLRAHPVFLGLAILVGLAQGINLAWYFRGINQTPKGVLLDFSGQALYVLLLFVLISGPEQAELVLVAQVIAYGGAQAVGLLLIATSVQVRLAPRSEAFRALGRGSALFALNAAVALYSAAGSLILSWLSTADQVANYAPAEKMIGSAMQLTGPLIALLLPFMTRAVVSDQRKAYRVIRGLCVILVGGAVVGAAIAALAGPAFMHMFLGGRFPEAGRVLAVLGMLLPFGILAQCLSSFLLIPLGKDRTVTGIAIMGGALNLLLALVLVPRYGAIGMGLSRVMTEAAIAMATLVVVAKNRLLESLNSASPIF